jgi:very-short-patch-repair endonuclease
MTNPSEHVKIPKELSELEETFALQLRAENIKYDREYLFDPERLYRADFFFESSNLIVEINGGTWMVKSGHNTGKGIQRDYDKCNRAQLLGFVYLQFTEKELNDLTALDTVKRYVRTHIFIEVDQ